MMNQIRGRGIRDPITSSSIIDKEIYDDDKKDVKMKINVFLTISQRGTVKIKKKSHMKN